MHPTTVKITNLATKEIVEDEESRLECVAEGSVPAANVTWRKVALAGTAVDLPAKVSDDFFQYVE